MYVLNGEHTVQLVSVSLRFTPSAPKVLNSAHLLKFLCLVWSLNIVLLLLLQLPVIAMRLLLFLQPLNNVLFVLLVLQ